MQTKQRKPFFEEEPPEDEGQQLLLAQLGQLVPIRQRKREKAQTELAEAKQRLATMQADHQEAEADVVRQREKSAKEIALLSMEYMDRPLDNKHFKDWQNREGSLLRRVYRRQEKANQIKAKIQQLETDIVRLTEEDKAADKKQQKLDMMLDYIRSEGI